MKRLISLIAVLIFITTYGKCLPVQDSTIWNEKHQLDSIISILSHTTQLYSNAERDYKIAKELIANEIVMYTAIMAILMLFFTFIITFLLPKNTARMVDRRILKLEQEFDRKQKQLENRYNEIFEKKLKDAYINSFRAFFEKATSTLGKYIWSIRYAKALFDYGEIIGAIKVLNIASIQLNKITDYTKLKPYSEGLSKHLIEIMVNENEEIKKVAATLYAEMVNRV